MSSFRDYSKFGKNVLNTMSMIGTQKRWGNTTASTSDDDNNPMLPNVWFGAILGR